MPIFNPPMLHPFNGHPTLWDVSEYFPLNEASGNRIGIVRGNVLTQVGTVGAAAGLVYPNVPDFEPNEALTCPSDASLQTGDIDFTIAAWVYLDTEGTDRNIVAKMTSGTPYEYFLGFINSSDRFRFLVYNGVSTQIGYVLANDFGAVSTATWYLVVAGHDASANQVFISVNAGIQTTASTTGIPAATAAVFGIGRLGSLAADYWDGRIGPVGYWKRRLTAAEITALYNAGAGLRY